MIDADPRPGYEPHMKDAKFLPKFRFRVWIDEAEKQWVKLDIQCIDTVSVGLFLLRLHKGLEHSDRTGAGERRSLATAARHA